MPLLFTLLFLYKQQLIRHEVKEKLEDKLLHTIIVPEAEVEWVRHNKEISIKDRLFDIKSFSIKNGQYVFTGLYDDEETTLINDFEKNTEQKNEGEHQVLSTLFQLLQSMYPGYSDETLIFRSISKAYRPLILQNISSPFINILTPPPQA